MGVTVESFGITNKGDKVSVYKLTNSKGLIAEVIDYGAILKSLYVPDRDGKLDDVVLGFDNIAAYQENPSFFGSTIGRNANRIGGAKFYLNGQLYTLAKNDNDHPKSVPTLPSRLLCFLWDCLKKYNSLLSPSGLQHKQTDHRA